MDNWLHVADRIRALTCLERKRYGKCNCRSGRGRNFYNPCERAVAFAQECEALAEGKGRDAHTILTWLAKHACARSRTYHDCNHSGCFSTDKAVAFIRGWLRGPVLA